MEQLANNASGALNGTITSSSTSLTLTAGQGANFPTTGNFRIIVEAELMLVGARAGDVLSSITRGIEGTSALPHNNGVAVTHIITAGGLAQFIVDQTAQVIPSGIVIPYGGSSAPTGWLLCDGSAVSRSIYSTLFGVVSTFYGTGDGTTTFNLPDMRGNVPVGKDAGTFASLGQIGGEETHVLATSEMPSHTHTFTGSALGSHSHTGSFTGNPLGGHTHTYTDYSVSAGTITTGSAQAAGGTAANTSSVSAGTPSGTVTVNSASAGTPSGTVSTVGSSAAHNNLQPYQVTNFIIKT